MIKTLWRGFRGYDTYGAFLERGAPRVAHKPLDVLGLKAAGVGTGSSRDIHGILMPHEVSGLVEVPHWNDVPVFDQEGTNSCVWCAITQAELITLSGRYALDLRTIERGSVLFGYRMTRGRMGLPIRDTGCYPSEALKVLADEGLPPESAWPFNQAKVNWLPGAKARWDAVDRRGVRGTYTIQDSSTDKIKQMRAAFASGRAVTFTIPIYSGFSGSDSIMRWSKAGDTLRGYHHVCAACSFESEGQYFTGVCNSWGKHAHTGGRLVLDEEYITKQASSMLVIDPEEPCQ